MPNITSVTLTAGVPTAGTGTVGTIDNVTGTAGSPSVPVLTVQGVASGTAQPVSIATLPALTTGAATIGALVANQSVNNAQVNGVTPLMGNGVTGTGSQRVTIASDNTAFAVNSTLSAETTKVIGTTRTLGNAGATLDFAGQNATSPANSLLVGAAFNTTPTTITSGNTSPLQMDNAGNLLVNIKAGASSGAVAQGSTTSGQTGSLIQGAVTTGAPTYTTAQTSPLSLDTTGALRVNVTAGGAGGGIVTQATAANLNATVKITDGTSLAAVKAASTAPVAADPAVVVSISPNSVNANISDGSAQTTSTHVGAPTVAIDPYSQYETVAASQTDQIMGATGGQYDYIAGVLVVPGTSAAGAVSIKDGNGSAISVFAGGGTTALADLKPFLVPLGLHCLAGTTPGWKITTGTNVTAIGIGRFT